MNVLNRIQRNREVCLKSVGKRVRKIMQNNNTRVSYLACQGDWCPPLIVYKGKGSLSKRAQEGGPVLLERYLFRQTESGFVTKRFYLSGVECVFFFVLEWCRMCLLPCT